ncbi:flagellar export chaperone FliS [Periweissella fabaria]|uniref:Flagellar secretion chaperone FliS n=1 Tax=Periweissella fabaria TaxID=546157 RepID=A0ABM8Z8D2_9LACO|nr:flagellar export chaperone FliS [Periweissella fabaria]MCM0597050.1 flagellar export chaperone FliS [Periweissella fabaria]CAH0417005.1 Flagellar secretion chaperone FliS [Periweissella fabaria]
MMNYQQTNQSYLKNQVMSASPAQLISMLMAGAIKNVKLAQKAIEAADKPKTHAKILLAQDIILELKYAVNQDVEGSVGPELINLYDYMYEQLVQANINNDPAKLAEVDTLMTDLLTTWKQIEV